MAGASCSLGDADGYLHSGKELARCHALVGDWEKNSRPWEAGVRFLTNRLEVADELQVRSLTLRNVQLNGCDLDRLALVFNASRSTAQPRLSNQTRIATSRAPHLRRIEFETNGLRADSMPALVRLVSSLPSLRALSLRSNHALGDSGARALRSLWTQKSAVHSLEVLDAGLNTEGVYALLELATHDVVSRTNGGDDGCFNLTISRNPLSLTAGIHSSATALNTNIRMSRASRMPVASPSSEHSSHPAVAALSLATSSMPSWHGGGGRRVRMIHDAKTGVTARQASLARLALGMSYCAIGEAAMPGLAAILQRFEQAELVSDFATIGHARRSDAMRDASGQRRARGGRTLSMDSGWSHEGLHVPPTVALTSLDVSGNLLGDSAAESLAATAARLPSLALLDVQNNPVGPDGFISLLSLARHRSLTTLRLPTPPRHAPVYPRHVRQAVATFEALGRHSALRELLFSADWLRSQPRIALALGDALHRGTSLTALDLSNVRIGAAAASMLANALGSPACRLISLRLASNDLSVQSVLRLAQALANNSRLQHLTLDHNSVGPVGSRALAASAAANGALLSVSLVNTGVGTKWRASLEEQLARNFAARQQVADRAAEHMRDTGTSNGLQTAGCGGYG